MIFVIRKILMSILSLLIVTSVISTTAAASEESYIIAAAQETSIKPALTFTFDTTNGAKEIDRITESQEFQDFLIKNSIDTTDYRLEVVSPNSTDNNLIMVTDGTNKWYYRVSNEPARHYALRDTPNYFALHNSCGRTVYYIGVGLFRWVSGVPIGLHRITRWNLPAGGVLNYRPDPEYTHVNLHFKYDKGEWFDTSKFDIPLGTWHNAYMCRNSRNGNYWSF